MRCRWLALLLQLYLSLVVLLIPLLQGWEDNMF
jgi:hypothetical protein